MFSIVESPAKHLMDPGLQIEDGEMGQQAEYFCLFAKNFEAYLKLFLENFAVFEDHQV